VRRGEALLALVSAADGGETGVGGIEWADERLSLNETVIDFAEAAKTGDGEKRYLRQSLGVFGGAYYSQMVEMGLFVVGSHGVPKASVQLGVPLAHHFRASIRPDVEGLLIEAIQTGRVSRDALATLGVVAPSQILEASSERTAYEVALFGNDETENDRDRNRRRSLLLILLVAERLGRRPTPDEVRWQLFETPGDDGWPTTLMEQRLRWEAYHAQDLLQIAAAGLLDLAISIMSEAAEGCSLAELRDQVHRWAQEAWSPSADWKTFRDALSPSNSDFRDWSGRVTGRRFAPIQRAADAVRLLAAVDARASARADLADEIACTFPSEGHGRSIRSELRWFHGHETEDASRLIAEYTVSRVVRRHSWVAMQKLRRQRDYTFLFEARDGRYVRRKSYQPVATTPRLAPAIQFLVDIDLLAHDGLTHRGRALVEAIQ
jgi:hypothetical protein